MTDLAAIVARDAACGGPLPDSALPEYQVLADRRALLVLLRETREALAEIWASIPASFDLDDPMVQRHSRALIALGPFLSALAALTERGSER